MAAELFKFQSYLQYKGFDHIRGTECRLLAGRFVYNEDDILHELLYQFLLVYYCRSLFPSGSQNVVFSQFPSRPHYLPLKHTDSPFLCVGHIDKSPVTSVGNTMEGREEGGGGGSWRT